jgi:ubiquinone/menaquinone biosynthesis C-methylase UbiE
VAITGGSKSGPAAPETAAFRSFRTADTRPDATSAQLLLNLVPEKERAVAGIARVLKPDGRVQIADIIIGEVPDEALRDIEDVAITSPFDCFAGTTKNRRRAATVSSA